MKQTKLWYAIADGGRARFVERDEGGEFRTVVSFVSTDLHTHARDLGTDRKTRVQDSAGSGRHAVEPRADLKQLAKEDFIGLVAEELAAEHGRDAFGRLMLVAPMLGRQFFRDQSDEIFLGQLLEVGPWLDRMTARTGAVLNPRLAVGPEIPGMGVQIGRHEADDGTEFTALVPLDKTRPAPIGDGIPELGLLHGLTRPPGRATS